MKEASADPGARVPLLSPEGLDAAALAPFLLVFQTGWTVCVRHRWSRGDER